MKVKDARKTSTSIIVRSASSGRITQSMDPFYELMRRIFREERTAMKGKKFIIMISEAEKEGRPLRTSDWEKIMKELEMDRSSFYSMRNKLLGGGLISIRNGEYHLSGMFSKDLVDMARWWWSAVLGNDPETL